MIKDKIFATQDRKRRKVDVTEWETAIFVQSMTGAERARFKALTDKLNREGNEALADTWLVIYTATDEAGYPIFTDEDFAALNNKSASVLTHIAKEALIVNGLLPESIEEAKKN
jgi:hypothetical protein